MTRFDMLENPEPGWNTRHVVRVVSSDSPPFWTIEIVREADGLSLAYDNEDLYVAWCRATEAAHMYNIRLRL